MLNKRELIKDTFFAQMPTLKPHDWDDMLESEGFNTFLNSVELAMDKHLQAHAIEYCKFINKNFSKNIGESDLWTSLDRGVTVPEQYLIHAYYESLNPTETANDQREPKHFEDDGAYAD